MLKKEKVKVMWSLISGTLEGIKKFLETNGEYGKAAPDHDEL